MTSQEQQESRVDCTEGAQEDSCGVRASDPTELCVCVGPQVLKCSRDCEAAPQHNPTDGLHCVCGAEWEKGQHGWEIVAAPRGVTTCGSNGTADCQSTPTGLRCAGCPHKHAAEPIAWTVAGEVTNWAKNFSKYRTQHYVRPVFVHPAPPARGVEASAPGGGGWEPDAWAAYIAGVLVSYLSSENAARESDRREAAITGIIRRRIHWLMPAARL